MRFLLLTAMLFLSFLTYGQEGKVIKVKDGDTIVILDENNTQITVRFANIDCPEKVQPFSKVASQFVSNEIYGKQVNVIGTSFDKYGRTIGYVIYDHKNICVELLKKGLAWHYQYFSDDAYLQSLEDDAKKMKLGLWLDDNPINPYDWRKGVR